MVYPIFQLLDFFTDDGSVLAIIIVNQFLQPFLRGISVQTSDRSSHISMILRATPIASRINGTGINAAADCKTTKACFPVAMIYCAVVGMTPWGFWDDVWIRILSDNAGHEWNHSPSPWNLVPYLGPQTLQRYTPSLPRWSLVHFQAYPDTVKFPQIWFEGDCLPQFSSP